MDSRTPKQRQFMLRNRSKIDKLLTKLEPPKKEKTVVLPKLKTVKKAVAEKVEIAAQKVVELPRLTAIASLPVTKEEAIPAVVDLKGLPRLKSVATAKIAKANKPKDTPLPRLQKIDKSPKTIAKPQAISIDLPRLKRIEKSVVEQDEDLGVLPKDFDKIDLPKLKRITKKTEEKVAVKVTALPNWVTGIKDSPKPKKKQKDTVVAKVEKAPVAQKEKPKKKKPSKNEVLNNISVQRSKLDFDKIGEATEADKDDLKKIKGLGASTEEKLNALGIYTYSQIVNLSDEEIDLVTEIIGFFAGRIKRDNWQQQAKDFMPKPAPAKKEKEDNAEEESSLDFDRIGTVEDGQGDDLTKIKGIGPATVKKLNGLGIRSYQQLASLTTKDEELIAEMISFSLSRIQKDNWAKQAKKILKE